MIYLQLLWVYLKIGTFGFVAMLCFPLFNTKLWIFIIG